MASRVIWPKTDPRPVSAPSTAGKMPACHGPTPSKRRRCTRSINERHRLRNDPVTTSFRLGTAITRWLLDAPLPAFATKCFVEFANTVELRFYCAPARPAMGRRRADASGRRNFPALKNLRLHVLAERCLDDNFLPLRANGRWVGEGHEGLEIIGHAKPCIDRGAAK